MFNPSIFYCQTVTGNTTDQIKLNKKIIIGEWVGQFSTFHFYQDNQFTLTQSEKGSSEKKIMKGEYAVVESGIFIRFFGSMHWPTENDHRDIHTSIQSKYLNLYKSSKLIDNQEDYSIIWEKKIITQ